MMKTSSDAAAGGRWGRRGRWDDGETQPRTGSVPHHCCKKSAKVVATRDMLARDTASSMPWMSRVGGGRGGHPCHRAAMHLLVRSGQHLQRGLVEIEAAARRVKALVAYLH